jgi:hypothetical protein
MFRSLNSNHLPLTAVGSNPDRDIGFFHVRGSPAGFRNVCCFTQVRVRAWHNARQNTLGLPPQVELGRRHMTFTVSVWRKTQTNNATNNKPECHATSRFQTIASWYLTYDIYNVPFFIFSFILDIIFLKRLIFRDKCDLINNPEEHFIIHVLQYNIWQALHAFR